MPPSSVGIEFRDENEAKFVYTTSLQVAQVFIA